MTTNPGRVRVAAAEFVSGRTRILELERCDGGNFGAAGGKYIILNTGLMLENGKAVKRAYSLWPVLGTDKRCQIAVKALAGPGSTALHAAEIGAEFAFSGPWGKLLAETDQVDSSLFVATDTGITAGLGALAQCKKTQRYGRLELLWLTEAEETFLGENYVEARAAALGVQLRRAEIPKVHDTNRIQVALEQAAQRVVCRSPRLLVAAGDGAILYPLREQFAHPATRACEVRIECFFNNPERKVS